MKSLFQDADEIFVEKRKNTDLFENRANKIKAVYSFVKILHNFLMQYYMCYFLGTFPTLCIHILILQNLKKWDVC